MESLVYLQLCCLHESPLPTATVPAKVPSTSAILLATTLLLGGLGGAERAYAQSLGDSSDAVRQIQFRLQVLGYGNVQPTGYYDLETRAAVMDFQQRNGLAADGTVGRDTRPILFGSNAEYSAWNRDFYPPENRSAYSFPTEGATIPSSLPQFSKPYRNDTPYREERTNPAFLAASVFQRGNRGDNIRIIQRRLRDLGYYYGSVDGVYGSLLQNAVERFQAERFLEVDGKVGSSTLAALGLSDLGGDRARGYVVVVPGNSDKLYEVQSRSGVNNARLQSSRRGSFVNAGQFASRHDAESFAARLRGLGLDARVAYNP